MACSWDKILMRKQLQREFEVYQRLPSHPRLIHMFGFSEPDDDGERGLILEYMPNGSLKAALESDTDIPVERRVRWCVEAAEAVVHLHSYGIIHADIRPENMVLDARLGVRIIDFSGASVDGKEALSLESTRFFLIRNVRDKAECNVTTDFFALGSSIYQIVVRIQPYEEVESQEVEARYARKEFPSVAGVLFGDIIRRCWMCEFSSAAEVLNNLTEVIGSKANGVQVRTFLQHNKATFEDRISSSLLWLY